MSARALARGFVLLAASAWIFGWLATEVAENETHLDTRVATWLHEHASPGWTDVFQAVTYLGNLPTLILVVAAASILLWRRGRVQEVKLLLLASIGTEILTSSLKLGFQRDRPFFPDPLATELTYSFPSGHASMSLAVYGTLAFILARHLRSMAARVAVLVAAALLVGLIGFSRIYLGVHYLSDVVAGFSLALAWVTLCVLALHLHAWRRTQTSR